MTSAPNLPKTASGRSSGDPPLPNLILYQTEAQRVENVLERTPSPPLIWRSGSATDNNTQRIFVTSKCNPFSFVQKSVLNKWIIEGNWICTFFPFKQKCELKSVVYIVICLTVAGIWQFFFIVHGNTVQFNLFYLYNVFLFISQSVSVKLSRQEWIWWI